MTDPMELAGRLEEHEARYRRSSVMASNRARRDHTQKSIATLNAKRADDMAEAAACIRELVEWRPIETFDALPNSRKPRPALFYFEPLIEGRTHLSATIELSRTFGRRVCTHWLPLPPAPGAEA